VLQQCASMACTLHINAVYSINVAGALYFGDRFFYKYDAPLGLNSNMKTPEKYITRDHNIQLLSYQEKGLFVFGLTKLSIYGIIYVLLVGFKYLKIQE
jgi:hypothetical protein